MNEEELSALRKMEEIMREFVGYVDAQIEAQRLRGNPVQAFAPRTLQTVEALHPILNRLDAARETG